MVSFFYRLLYISIAFYRAVASLLFIASFQFRILWDASRIPAAVFFPARQAPGCYCTKLGSLMFSFLVREAVSSSSAPAGSSFAMTTKR